MKKLLLFGLLLWAMPAFACTIPSLPEPLSNNAVAYLDVGGKRTVFSFYGIGPGKTYRDITRAAFSFTEGPGTWKRLPDVPVSEGRLAATAVAVVGKVYLFGGYTVAADGAEVSTPDVFAFDPVAETYERLPNMPLPVDDSVSLAYADRYIYLVSGWHTDGNVKAVQVFDTETRTWARASDYPGTPVFGHAGGIVGGRFVIADGVAVVGQDDRGKRIFDTVNEGWLGEIDPEDPTKIAYRRLPQLPGRGHYRMGAAGQAADNRVIFFGGTPTAYNYNGIGYDGTPAVPQAHVFGWDFTADTWVAYADKSMPSMDHRGLVQAYGKWYTIGGMVTGQQVTDRAIQENWTACK